MKVLIVDDYKSAALVTGHLFEMLGHEVVLANSGVEAIIKAKDFEPGLILLDIGMPGMDGFETCKLMRTEHNLKDIQIIAQTGRGDDETIETCMSSGFDEHLLKPIEIKNIQKIINTIN